MKEDKLHILCATDERYVSNCGVMLTSVFENNTNVDAYVLVSEQLSKKNSNKFRKLEQRYNTNIHIIIVDSYLLAKFPIPSAYWSKAIYYRLYAAQLIPITIDRMLYLDCDIIVNGNLRELWEVDLTNKSAAVVSDVQYNNPEHNERMNLPKDNKYFNSGMMLINLKYWRDKSLLDNFLACIEEYKERLKFNDQDVLNKVLVESKVHVNFKWNFIVVAYHHEFFDKLPAEIQERTLNIEPTIIHYTGGPWARPWMSDYYFYPFAERWDYYKKLSPWRWKTSYTKHHFVRKFVKRQILWPLGIMKSTLGIVDGINKKYIR